MTTLYRGIAPTGGLDKDVVYELAASGDREGALTMVLDFLSSNNPDSSLGIGRHWSTDRSVSKQWSKSPFALNILMEAHWDGNGEDLERTNTFGDWDDEEEITLLPGTPVELVSLTINSSYRGEIELISGSRTITALTAGHDMKHLANRTAAEEGGVLPWVPSQNGYYWITKNDDSLEAVTNDGVNRMRLYEKPWGWEWVVKDDIGVVEKGNFGSALTGGDALRDRADDLLAEFDTNPLRRTRGPSQGFQDDYTQAPNTLWSKREALYHDAGNSDGVAIVLTFPMEYREAIADPEGTPAEELHITLGYFGKAGELDPEQEDKFRQACILTASWLDPFVATLGGLIRFSGEEKDAFVLSADSPLIEYIREILLGHLAMTGAAAPDATHGFTPHCTLGYLNPDDPLPFERWEPVEVPITSVELWWGEAPEVFPLGITPAVAMRKTTSQRYAERLKRKGRR